MLGKKPEELKLISCHLGNGSSVTAVDGGKSVDTSMGFTPLAGLPMGTRAGDLDAGILEYMMGKYNYDIKEMVDILNKKSGVQGVSGVSSDFRDLENAHKEGNERAGLAVDMFNYGVKKLIGAYAAAMGGVDAIVFTAGVGENSADQRLAIASDLEFMGRSSCPDPCCRTWGTFPDELAVVLSDLDLAIPAADLAIVALGVELGIDDVVIDELHHLQHCLQVVLHVGHFHVADGAAGRESLELRLELQLVKGVDLLRDVDMVAVGDVSLVGDAGNDAEAALEAFGEFVGSGFQRCAVERIVDVFLLLPFRTYRSSAA